MLENEWRYLRNCEPKWVIYEIAFFRNRKYCKPVYNSEFFFDRIFHQNKPF